MVTQTPLSKADLVVFYEALTGSLDKLYTQLDDVFADADGLIKAQMQQKQQFSDAKLVVDDHKNVTIQLRDMKTLPFSFDAVTSSMSKILKEQSVKEGDGADEVRAYLCGCEVWYCDNPRLVILTNLVALST